jgi:hypothetical protein
MGDLTAHHHSMGLAWQVNVIGVAAFSGQQRRVFHSANRLPNTIFINRE